jgi:transposase
MVCIKPLMHIMDKPVVRAPRRRREHSAEFKKELVARSLEPGVSVAAIAMEGGINANLLFGWRRKHQNAIAQGGDAALRRPAAVLLPVSIETAPAERPCTPSTPSVRSGGGIIEIEIGSARMRLRGSVDEASLRTVLTALRSLA